MSSSERYCATCGASNTVEEERCFACGGSLDLPDPLSLEYTSAAHILRQRYRLLAQVGEGGFSAVYKAEDLKAKHYVAIKAVTLRGLTAQQKIEATDAFNREVSLLGNLRHRNLPRIHDHFSDTECWYLVMDFIDGITLEKHLEQKGTTALTFTEVLDLGLLLCDVLEYLHKQHPAIIYRDLKPANTMLTHDGYLFLIDFGIARQFKPGQAKDTIPFGSPGYAAPEQYGKAQTTPRADIYSLGAILHQLLSGDDPSHTPFSFAPLRLSRQAGGEEISALLLRMVDIDVNKRPENIDFVRQELRKIAERNTYGTGPFSTWATPQLPAPQPIPVYWQAANGQNTGGSVGATMAGQIQFAPPPIVPAQQNNYAIASLVLSLVGIFLPPFFCFLSASSLPYILHTTALTWIASLLLLTPSVLGIIFGHIGSRRAKTIPGMQASADTAMTGMTIGYIFASIYLVFFFCILASATVFVPHY